MKKIEEKPKYKKCKKCGQVYLQGAKHGKIGFVIAEVKDGLINKKKEKIIWCE